MGATLLIAFESTVPQSPDLSSISTVLSSLLSRNSPKYCLSYPSKMYIQSCYFPVYESGSLLSSGLIPSNLLAQNSKPVRLCLNLLFQPSHLPRRLPPFVSALMSCLLLSRCSELSRASRSLSLECLWLLKPTLKIQFSITSGNSSVLQPTPVPALGSSRHLSHCTLIIS